MYPLYILFLLCHQPVCIYVCIFYITYPFIAVIYSLFLSTKLYLFFILFFVNHV